jgi:hypothetical protein
VLDKLRTLPVGKKPSGDWAEFLGTADIAPHRAVVVAP